MVKNFLRAFCQKIIGYKNYLFIFSLYNIKKIELGKHEKEFSYFITLLDDQGVILDIGANIGIMTVILAKKLNKATIYSFEPIPDNQRAFERVIRFYKLSNVKLFKTALGDQIGELKMILPVIQNAKMQGLCHVIEADDEKGEVYSVPVMSLDEMEEIKSVSRITAIKIDVENFEYFVFKGGREILLKHRPIIYSELLNTERRNICINYLKGLGYNMKVFVDNRLIDFIGQNVINFFFLPTNSL